MLSATYKRAGCYIGAYTYGEKFAQPFFAGFEGYAKSIGGRGHWGKYLTITADEARAQYPLYDRFNEIRRHLDPRGLFMNDFTRRIFER